jgi:4-hydroxybenzoate polyprenyltransferase
VSVIGTPAAGPPSTFLGKLSLAAADIKLAHSVFALPFAVLGAFLARRPGAGWADFLGVLLLIVACMVTARTWAMLVNRLADRGFDAKNARTSRRAFAAERLSARFGWGMALASAAVFIACAGLFWVFEGNLWPVVLSVPVLAWLAAYSFTKRFTRLCHVWLGVSLALSPLAAAIAVHPPAVGLSAEGFGFVTPVAPAVFWIAAMVAAWVAGFDVIYAMQDIEFDRAAGLSSLPSAFGWTGAAWIARLFHIPVPIFLTLTHIQDERFGTLFTLGIAAVLILLCTEHFVLARSGRKGLDIAFFTVNGFISVLLGVVGCLDLAF